MNLENDIRILSDLVACATISDRSNLDIVDYIDSYLMSFGASTWRVASQDGRKASLLARLGPDVQGGLMLSAHTDVVPVEGQAWATDPFKLTRVGDRFYGRGAADMKGFIASALACVPDIILCPLAKPVYFAFSYDEELGCLGVHDLIDDLKARAIAPDLCIVGEPTSMEIGLAHKGNRTFRLKFTGQAAHSSRAPTAVNAVNYAARYVSSLTRIASEIAEEGPFDAGFDIPHTTVHVGGIRGGTQVNIVPDACVVDMEFRYLPGEDCEALSRRFVFEPAALLSAEMTERSKDCGVGVEEVYSYPAFGMSSDHQAVTLAKRCAGKNADVKLSYGTEAGCFTNAMNIAVVVCGPGDIAQAHKADEFIELQQLAEARKFILESCHAFCSSRR